jgi:hypothetical protein
MASTQAEGSVLFVSAAVLLQELKRLLELPLWQVPALPPGQNAYNLPTIAAYVESVVGRVGASTLPPAGGPSNGSSSSQKQDRGYLLLSHHWQVGSSPERKNNSLKFYLVVTKKCENFSTKFCAFPFYLLNGTLNFHR